jgi:hypothetical protein
LIVEIKTFSNLSEFHFLLSEFCEISGKKSVTPISVAFSIINLFLSLFFVGQNARVNGTGFLISLSVWILIFIFLVLESIICPYP